MSSWRCSRRCSASSRATMASSSAARSPARRPATPPQAWRAVRRARPAGAAPAGGLRRPGWQWCGRHGGHGAVRPRVAARALPFHGGAVRGPAGRCGRRGDEAGAAAAGCRGRAASWRWPPTSRLAATSWVMLQTQATRSGGGWQLDGLARRWCWMHLRPTRSSFPRATAARRMRPAGVTLFLVPKDAAGLTVSSYPTQSGGRAGDVQLAGVSVGPEAVIGSGRRRVWHRCREGGGRCDRGAVRRGARDHRARSTRRRSPTSRAASSSAWRSAPSRRCSTAWPRCSSPRSRRARWRSSPRSTPHEADAGGAPPRDLRRQGLHRPGGAAGGPGSRADARRHGRGG